MSTKANGGLAAALAENAVATPVASSVQRTSDHLRGYLIEGKLTPGTQLSEEALASAFAISRNTLREAFRILTLEGLLVHRANRGVFVRELSRDDVMSNYQFRILLESAAARDTDTHTNLRKSRVRLSVTEGLAAAEDGDWAAVGTANMHFHRAIAGLAGIDRLDLLMDRLLAEMRLAQHVMRPLASYHVPYLEDNERICGMIEAGRGEEAAAAIAEYLGRAREQLLTQMP